jgi:hypothetical protein
MAQGQALTMTSGRVCARGRALDCVDATGPRVGREFSGSEADHGTIGDEVAHGRVVATGARLCSRVRRRASGERVGRLVGREASGSEADHGTLGDEVARGRVAATGARLCSPRVGRESIVGRIGGRSWHKAGDEACARRGSRGRNGQGSFLNKARETGTGGF